MAYLARSAFVLLGLAHVHAGCDDLFETRACTDVYCSSETSVLIERPGVAWADGDYTLDIHLGGEQHRCLFTLPIPGKLPHELQLRGEPVGCSPEVPATHLAAAVALLPTPNPSTFCPQPDGGPPLASCPPLAGRYHIEVRTTAVPEELGLRLALGDAMLLDRTAAVEYATFYPNGEGCGSPCSSADLAYRITEPP